MYKVVAIDPNNSMVFWVIFRGFSTSGRIIHYIDPFESNATEFTDISLAFAIINKLNKGKRKKYFVSEN